MNKSQSYSKKNKISKPLISLFKDKRIVSSPEPTKIHYKSSNKVIIKYKSSSMTSLYNDQFVYKDHPIIVFRGKLDSLISEIIEAQVLGQQKNNIPFINDLQEILDFVCHLLNCECLRKMITKHKIMKLSLQDMQKISHNIFKKQKNNNTFSNYKMGVLSSKLNLLRTKTRSAEIAAISAFRNSNGQFIREDIIEALNRLSSLFYILMDKYSDKKSDL